MGLATCSYNYSVSYLFRDTKVCQDLLKKDFSIEASTEDCEIVRRVCEAVSTRAARMAAAGVVTLVKKIDKLDGCTVAVDGSLYKKHPKFSHRCVVILSILLLFSLSHVILYTNNAGWVWP